MYTSFVFCLRNSNAVVIEQPSFVELMQQLKTNGYNPNENRYSQLETHIKQLVENGNDGSTNNAAVDTVVDDVSIDHNISNGDNVDDNNNDGIEIVASDNDDRSSESTMEINHDNNNDNSAAAVTEPRHVETSRIVQRRNPVSFRELRSLFY